MAGVAPANALAFAALATAQDNVASWEQRSANVLPLLAHACALYPLHGDVLLQAAQGYWRAYQMLAARAEQEESLAYLVELIRRAGEVYPHKFRPLLHLLWSIRPNAELIASLVPDILSGQEQLAAFFQDQA